MTCPVIAAVLLCLAGAFPAQTASYAIRAPYAARFAGLPLQAGAITVSEAGWDVTLAFDPEKCEIYCVYRRTPDAFGRIPAADYLLPPAITIQIYPNAVSLPDTVVLNPGGIGVPTASARVPDIPERTCLLSQRVLSIPNLANHAGPQASTQQHFFTACPHVAVSFTSAPLRV